MDNIIAEWTPGSWVTLHGKFRPTQSWNHKFYILSVHNGVLSEQYLGGNASVLTLQGPPRSFHQHSIAPVGGATRADSVRLFCETFD